MNCKHTLSKQRVSLWSGLCPQNPAAYSSWWWFDDYDDYDDYNDRDDYDDYDDYDTDSNCGKMLDAGGNITL